MRAVIQRVSSCTVEVKGTITGKIGKGLLVYLGIGKSDTEEDVCYLANKIVSMRIFEDKNDKMNFSLNDYEHYGILVISQFTLLGDARKGRRPSYSNAAPPREAEQLYTFFLEFLRNLGKKPEKGEFQVHMKVTYTNDGPVTILLDSKKLF